MKKRNILCIVMLIIMMVPANIYAADSSMNFRYTLSANGGISAEAVPGDEIEVTAALSRTDSSDSFPMYAIQYDLWYNADMLEIVEDSLNSSSGVSVITRELSGSWKGWNSIVVSSFSTRKDGDLWPNTVDLFSLRMKTKKVGTSMILSHQTSVSTTNGMDSYVTESNDVSVIVRNQSAGDDDSGNDPVNPDPGPTPDPTPNPGENDDTTPSAEEVDRVISLIESIGTVTLDSESSITAAREAYDRLSQTEQAAVSNYEILVQAEAALAELKSAQDDDNDSDSSPSLAFRDLDPSAWYRGAVDFVLNSKYFQGTSDTTFEPDGSMTRAMFVTVLSRMEGIDAAQYSGSDFTDVETGQWYTAAIQWASQNGIVLGVGEQKFDPEGEVTREQMAAIMYRYAQYKKIDTTKADASKFGSFSDKDSVSDWAVEAMTWATGIGIINGTDTGIEPQANSTRAQVAQIVKNYTEKVS